MRKRIGSIIWGILFIVAGVGFAGNAFGLWNFDLFFSGWWTLFLIIPAAVSMVENGPNTGNSILLLAGLVLLLSAQGFIQREIIGKLFFPVVLVLVGLSILLGSRAHHTAPKEAAAGAAVGPHPSYNAVFSGSSVRWPAEPFAGATLSAVFGGVDLDLREAVITQDVIIDATVVFGGIDLYVPPNVRVKVAGTPVFGGVENKAAAMSEDAPTIYVNCTCIFGGMDIK